MINFQKTILFCLIFSASVARAQKIDSIYVNLYTDSLKKGTFNYINIDGLLSNGKYLPLDSTQLILWASEGKFRGNSLWIDKNFAGEKISFKATLRNNPLLYKEFVIFIKKKTDPELKTVDELMKDMQSKDKPKHKS